MFNHLEELAPQGDEALIKADQRVLTGGLVKLCPRGLEYNEPICDTLLLSSAQSNAATGQQTKTIPSIDSLIPCCLVLTRPGGTACMQRNCCPCKGQVLS